MQEDREEDLEVNELENHNTRHLNYSKSHGFKNFFSNTTHTHDLNEE